MECLDAEALRVIKQMPKWKPGKQKEKMLDANIEYLYHLD